LHNKLNNTASHIRPLNKYLNQYRMIRGVNNFSRVYPISIPRLFVTLSRTIWHRKSMRSY